MSKIKKTIWFSLGILFLGVAYLGVILPGLPWSTPTVIAAYCFAKSSERMNKWIYGHPLFGPFLTNWQEKRVFPTRAKYLMVITMLTSLTIMWITTGNGPAVGYTGLFMLLVALWGWRYPGSVEEHQRRKDAGKKIAWLN
jgi:uncharacterized membrane protein YbaN (DUF454 family)